MGARELPTGWDQYATQLGLNVARARERRNLSQEKLAQAANITRHTYQRLEKGYQKPGSPSNPTLATVVAVCLVLGERLEDILPELSYSSFPQRAGEGMTRPLTLEPVALRPRRRHNIYGTRIT